MKKRKQIKKEIETAKDTTKAYYKRNLHRNLGGQWYYQTLNRSQERHPKSKPPFFHNLSMPRKRIIGLIIGLAIIATVGIVVYANLFLHFNVSFRL